MYVCTFLCGINIKSLRYGRDVEYIQNWIFMKFNDAKARNSKMDMVRITC